MASLFLRQIASVLRRLSSVLLAMLRALNQLGAWLRQGWIWLWSRPTRSRNAFSWVALALTLCAIWVTSAAPFVGRSITATFVFYGGIGFQALNASGDILFTKTFDGSILGGENSPMIEELDVNGDMQQDVVVGVGSGAEGGQLLAYSTAFHWWRGTDGLLIGRYGVTGGAIRFLIKRDFEGVGTGVFVVGWDPNLDPATCEQRVRLTTCNGSPTTGTSLGVLRFVSASEPPPMPNQGFDWVGMLDRKLGPVWERTFCSRYLSIADVAPTDEDGDKLVDYVKVKDTAGHEYQIDANGNWGLVERSPVPVDPAYFGPKWEN